jgi:hypothetical protein
VSDRPPSPPAAGSSALRGWLWPPAEEAGALTAALFSLAGCFSALIGVVAVLVEMSHDELVCAGSAVGVSLCGLLAPALWKTAGALLARRGRRPARLLAFALALAVAGLASWSATVLPMGDQLRKAVGFGVMATALALWAGVTLGRRDVRDWFDAAPVDPPDRASWTGWALYAVFVVTTFGTGLSVVGSWVTGHGPIGHGLPGILGAIASGAMCTLGAWIGRALWRGPDAEVERVPPEVWTRIVAMRAAGAAEVLATLEREGVPPPGRRWTLEVVQAVLDADAPRP